MGLKDYSCLTGYCFTNSVPCTGHQIPTVHFSRMTLGYTLLFNPTLTYEHTYIHMYIHMCTCDGIALSKVLKVTILPEKAKLKSYL